MLEPSEYIYKVTGTSLEIIDSLTFWTTFGRQFSIGTNRRGKFFELSWGRKIIQGFKVGFGRYLHKIGVFFRKSKGCYPVHQPNSSRQILATRFNHRFQNNQAIVQVQRNNEISLHHDNRLQAQPNPVIKVANQRSGKMHNHNAPYSPHTNNEDDSSSVSSQEINSYRSRESIANRMRRSQSLVDRNNSTRYYTMLDNEEEKKICPPKKSNPCGMKYSNTILFDDYEELTKDHNTICMKQLRVIHDNNYVYGLQGVYEIDGKICTTRPHWCSFIPTFAINEAVILMDGETITSIEGTFVDVINGLKIKTSKGLIYNFGITDSNINYVKSFKHTVPFGKRMIAIAGGFNSYLHNVSVYYI